LQICAICLTDYALARGLRIACHHYSEDMRKVFD
jgi:hypothetical protein